MLMNNMDESLDSKPTVVIEGKLVELLKIKSAYVGEKFTLEAKTSISDIQQYMGSDGIVRNRIIFELSGIRLTDPEVDLSSMFSKSPKPEKRK